MTKLINFAAPMHRDLLPSLGSITRLAFWSALAGVLALALLPQSVALPSTGWDKGNHVLAFAVLGCLGCLGYPTRLRQVVAGLLAFGVLIEVLQLFTPDRHGEMIDLVADAVGLLLGGIAFIMLQYTRAHWSR